MDKNAILSQLREEAIFAQYTPEQLNRGFGPAGELEKPHHLFRTRQGL